MSSHNLRAPAALYLLLATLLAVAAAAAATANLEQASGHTTPLARGRKLPSVFSGSIKPLVRGRKLFSIGGLPTWSSVAWLADSHPCAHAMGQMGHLRGRKLPSIFSGPAISGGVGQMALAGRTDSPVVTEQQVLADVAANGSGAGGGRKLMKGKFEGSVDSASKSVNWDAVGALATGRRDGEPIGLASVEGINSGGERKLLQGSRGKFQGFVGAIVTLGRRDGIVVGQQPDEVADSGGMRKLLGGRTGHLAPQQAAVSAGVGGSPVAAILRPVIAPPPPAPANNNN